MQNMNPFKKCDKVRFVDNELNRAEISPDNILSEHTVIEIGISKDAVHLENWGRPFHYSRFEPAEPAVGSREWVLKVFKEYKSVCHPSLPNLSYSRGAFDLIYEQSTENNRVFSCNDYHFNKACLDKYPNGWQLYEPVPTAKFGNVKVGWYAVFENDMISNRKITSVREGTFFVDGFPLAFSKISGEYGGTNEVFSKIIKIVPPEEVKIPFSTYITIRPDKPNLVWLHLGETDKYSFELDYFPDQADTVKALLAQEGK